MYQFLSGKQWGIRFGFVVDERMIIIRWNFILELLPDLTTKKGFHLAHTIMPSMQLFLVWNQISLDAFSSFEHLDLLIMYYRSILVPLWICSILMWQNLMFLVKIVKTVEVGIALSNISSNGWRRMFQNSLRSSRGEASKS